MDAYDNFYKFLFLGVMILVVFFANRGIVYKQVANVSQPGIASNATSGEPPIFILEPPQAEAEDVSAVAVDTKQQSSTISALSESGSASYNYKVSSPRESSLGGTLSSAGAVGRSVFRRVRDGQPPALQARAALVADLASGEKFFSLEPTRRWPMASLTKLVSAAVVSRNILLHQSTTLIAADFSIDDSEDGFKAGDRYAAGDLMLAMLLKSNNESAEALARLYRPTPGGGVGGRAEFVAAMNNLARAWGLRYTHFDDPTGLSTSNQSTAGELLELAVNVYKQHPEILEITRRGFAPVTELNSGKSFIISNINLFADWACPPSGDAKDIDRRVCFLGGKTGYTDEANGNLLSVFSYKRQPIVIIVLGTPDRFGETELLLNWFIRNFAVVRQ